jgi:hypothetical protein
LLEFRYLERQVPPLLLHYITLLQGRALLAIAYDGSNHNLYNIRVLTIYKISNVCVSSALDFESSRGLSIDNESMVVKAGPVSK